MPKSVAKVPKNFDFRKSVPQFPTDPKIWGGGGVVRPVLDEVQIKAAFIFEKLPKLVNIVPREFEGQKPSGPQASICEISMELHCNLKNHES